MFGRKDTRLRKDRKGANPITVGAAVLLVAAVATYFGFSKHVPFTHGFRVNAVFESANSIRPNSPVRIAGVNVGKVKQIKRQDGTDAAIVTMWIDKKGLPIHKDATLKIRPRIFLEGNFFVDLKPGTPSAPTISDDDTLPITQTSTPVQLDQVLTALQSDTREDLKQALKGYGTALTYAPTAADNTDSDPLVRGKTAAQSLNAATKTAAPALKGTAIVNQALLGTQPHDLSKLIAGLGKVTTGLDKNEQQLKDLVTNFNTTMAAFASEDTNLRSTIRLLAPTLEHADSALTHLNQSFPNTRAFAREILPGVRETPATIDASFPWVAQTRKLLGPAELQGVAKELRPTTASLSKVVDTSIELFPQADLLSKCLTKVILPTGDIKIEDGALSTGKENYKEFWYTMVGIAGEGQNFDGNGMYVRFQPGGGDQTISTGKVGGAAGDVLFGNAPAKPLGTRPAFPGKRPPYRPDVPCYTQPIPDLNSAVTGPPEATTVHPSSAAADPSALPATPVTRSAKRSARSTGATAGTPTASSPSTSVGSELVARLNPFRTAGKGVGK
jgi:phospholipid/cholesterol/gamma-HCH transport system substrate-binding protein